MWIFYVALIAVWSGSVLAMPQRDPMSETSEADGFIFDGPVNRPTSRVTVDSTSTIPPTQRRPTSTTTTPASNAQTDDCVQSCRATPEYNPVCGTDNVLYDNPGLLKCAALCGKNVALNYYGPCQTSGPRG